MAQSYWPFDGVDTTETQYSQLFRRLQSTGVWGDSASTDLKLVQGSGLNTTLKAGYALIRGHMYYNDADLTTVAIGGGSANPRIDLVVLRLNPTANTITPVVIAGTPSATPVAPAPTQTDAGNYDLVIAQVYVPASAGSIVTGNITDVRSFMGHIFGLWTTANRPTSPRRGQPGWNETLGIPEYWDPTSGTWKSFIVTAVTAAMISSGEQLLLSVGNSALLNGAKYSRQQTAPSSPADGDVWLSKA